MNYFIDLSIIFAEILSKIIVHYTAFRKTNSETTNTMEFQLSLKKHHLSLYILFCKM